jgi:hypothetical protein
MKLQYPVFLVLLAACSGQDNRAPVNTAGAPAAGASPGSAGSGGLGAAGMSGAAGAAGSSSTVSASFETFKSVITQAPCFGAGCHNDAQNPLNLRVDDQLYTRLTSHMSKNCGNLPVVNPGKPQESALVKILKGPCGTTPRMPLGCVDDQDSTCIPAEYIAAITQWIESGAPRQ